MNNTSYIDDFGKLARKEVWKAFSFHFKQVFLLGCQILAWLCPWLAPTLKVLAGAVVAGAAGAAGYTAYRIVRT